MISKIKEKYILAPVQVKASFWFLICAFMQKGISTITTPVFTRLLNTSEYGQYNVFNSWLGIITIFVSLNLSLGVYTQGLVKFSNDRNVFSSSLQGLTVMLVIIWTAVYWLLRDFWNRIFGLTTIQMQAMLLMIWTSAVFNFWASEQRVLYKYQKLVLLTIIVSVAKPTLGIILVTHSSDKVTARILGILLVELIGYLGLFFSQMLKGKCFFDSKFWKYALLFNIPLVPHYLSQTVLNSSDRIMINKLVDSDSAGIYSLAYSISLLMTLFNTALVQTISPWMYQKIKNNQIEDISSVAYITLSFVAVVNIILIAFAPEIVYIFAPKEYYEAIYIIPPVAMSVYFMFSYDLFAKFAFYYEKTFFIMIASVSGAILNIVLNYIFIKKFGYIAAGYTTLICFMVYSIAHYIFMTKICNDYCQGKKPYNLKIILLITYIMLAAGNLFLITYNNIFLRYIIIFFVFIILGVNYKRIYSVLKQVMALRR